MSNRPSIETDLLRHASAVVGWLGVLMIAVLSLLPGSMLRAQTLIPGPLGHTLAYAATGVALAFGYRRIGSRLLALGGLSFASAIFEFLQAYTPGRSSSGVDVVASSGGAALGILLGAVIAKLAVDAGIGHKS